MEIFLKEPNKVRKKNVWNTYYEDRLFQKAEEYGSLNHET